MPLSSGYYCSTIKKKALRVFDALITLSIGTVKHLRIPKSSFSNTTVMYRLWHFSSNIQIHHPQSFQNLCPIQLKIVNGRRNKEINEEDCQAFLRHPLRVTQSCRQSRLLRTVALQDANASDPMATVLHYTLTYRETMSAKLFCLLLRPSFNMIHKNLFKHECLWYPFIITASFPILHRHTVQQNSY